MVEMSFSSVDLVLRAAGSIPSLFWLSVTFWTLQCLEQVSPGFVDWFLGHVGQLQGSWQIASRASREGRREKEFVSRVQERWGWEIWEILSKKRLGRVDASSLPGFSGFLPYGQQEGPGQAASRALVNRFQTRARRRGTGHQRPASGTLGDP